jgi:16S rRNA (cytosine967-C5)-methyltransferase
LVRVDPFGAGRMTPGARAAAAIVVLDRVLLGDPAEKALTNWGRANRFAGSGDRAAIRDLVFDALRRKRSAAARGGGMTGRGLVLGLCREAGLETLFDGLGHAPSAPLPTEVDRIPTDAEALDLPDWLLPRLSESLGPDLGPVAKALRHRAPVFLRVNRRKADLATAIATLADEAITARPHPLADTALEVVENARKAQTSAAYVTGLVELQDAASQAVVAALPLADGMRVLDHCAGGGGKTLAMADRADLALFAHDISPRRMVDLVSRARRAGVSVTLTDRPETLAPYDLVLVDAPCSGSGSWRRDPEGKWALSAERLGFLLADQAEILQRAAKMVAPGGALAYVTCSILQDENADQVKAFLAQRPGWVATREISFLPMSGGDGFYLCLIRRN